MGRSLLVSLEGSPVLPRPSLDASRRSVALGELACAVLRLLSPAVVVMMVICCTDYVDTVLRFVLVESGPSARLVLLLTLLLTLLVRCGTVWCGAVRCGARC